MYNKKTILALFIAFILLPINAIACQILPGRQITDQLVNNKEDHAQKILSNQLIRDPSYPMGGFYQGRILWKKSVRGQNKKLAQQAFEVLKQSISKSQKELKKSPNNSRIRINSGMSQMLLARIHASRKEWRAAYSNGKKARVDLLYALNKVGDKDAIYGLGLIEFFAGSIPSSFRWIAALSNFKGSKKKGIELIKESLKESPMFAPEAARFIANGIIFGEPENQCQFVDLMRHIRQRYPNKPFFSIAYQKIHNMCGYTQQALNDNNRAYKQFAKLPEIIERLDTRKLYILSNLGKVKEISAIKSKSKAESYHREKALGMAYDVINDRENAKQAYVNAQKLSNNVKGADKNISFLSSPYKKPSPQPVTSNFILAKGCS